MRKIIILCFSILAIAISLPNTNPMAQANNSPENGHQQDKPSPFLITSGLPHLTKLLLQQWDNSTLNLTKDQKDKLLVIRKETMSGVKNLAPQIVSLQKEVTGDIFSGKAPDGLKSAVQDISKLKAAATMIHLKCIYDTTNVLNKEQLDFLLKK